MRLSVALLALLAAIVVCIWVMALPGGAHPAPLRTNVDGCYREQPGGYYLPCTWYERGADV